jgi:hypothetical protein
MKSSLGVQTIVLCTCALFSAAAARTQGPPPNSPAQNQDQYSVAPQKLVPITNEPHHRVVLSNDYVHVYNVQVPPLDATLIHQHDLPYLYVVLGPADLVNVVVGKPETHLTYQDGDVRYSPGGFAHLVRTDSGTPFHNITIELVRPQGTAKNLCQEVIPGQPTSCPQQAAAGKKASEQSSDDDIPYFETDELKVDLIKVSNFKDYVDGAPALPSLLVALSNANLNVNLGGEHISFLHEGDVLWLPAGVHRHIVDFLGTRSSFLLISFKDKAASQATPAR